MKVFLFVALVAVSLAKESPLKAVLQSPLETLKLYNKFKGEQHLSYSGPEDRLRFMLFKRSAELVAEENSVDDETAEFTLNFFSTMTDSEKQSWTGLNVTGHNPNDLPGLELASPPSSKLWTGTKEEDNKDVKVTAVKNQKGCGSCWSFGAVGGLETRYAIVAGVLRNFAEQEYLDCVYEGRRNGCNGGWMQHCYEYSRKAGGRLAKTADYAYTARDGSCQGSSKPDAMIAARITGYVAVGRSESANIAAIAEGSITVAFEVTNRFHSYSHGILKDTTCTGRPNHAVTAVGYTSSYVLVKNSWGPEWGDQGFVRFARNYHNCNLFDYSFYPTLAKTNKNDNGGNDEATDYNADDDSGPDPEPDCVDSYSPCYKKWCRYDWIKEDYCQKTCGNCGGSDKCPSGTIRCPDGVCRHEHMC